MRENSHLGCFNGSVMLDLPATYVGGLWRIEWKLRHMEKLYGIVPANPQSER